MLYTTDETKRESDSEGFRAAVREFRRVIRLGGVCFITVPYGKSCNRGWFQVFDATMIQAVLDEFQPAHREIEYFRYSDAAWHARIPLNRQERLSSTFTSKSVSALIMQPQHAVWFACG